MSVTISPQALDRLKEVLARPDNQGSKLRVIFEGFG